VSNVSNNKQDKKAALKGLIKKLHEGADPESMKEKFKEVAGDVDATEIGKLEEEMIKEGMPREEVHRLCDVHLAVFKESLDKEKTVAPPGHPIHILMEEHKMILRFAEELKCATDGLGDAKGLVPSGQKLSREQMKELQNVAKHFKDSASHYVREENVLFPYLEKHGVTEPPAVMWMDHNKIREIEKRLFGLLNAQKSATGDDSVRQLKEVAVALGQMLSNHFYKENNILFQMALKVIPQDEWRDVRQQFDELGYCPFTPESAKIAAPQVAAATARPSASIEARTAGPRAGRPSAGIEAETAIQLETGSLPAEAIQPLFNTLPVDVTFVDENDMVRYFNEPEHRIFPRTKAVIGRTVQQCHPQSSVHVVNQLLEDFRSGRRDVAEFWINQGGRVIYIRYFAVRDDKGQYLGCLEVAQDITEIQKLKGEKRLLTDH
jgi:PAS domain S-box-containing protein